MLESLRPRGLPWPRRVLAMVLLPFGSGAWHYVGDPIVPLACLLACALLLNWANIGAQLVVRATLALTILSGLLMADRPLAVVAAACALLALGGAGLEARPGSVFSPVRFRGPLLASLVVAIVEIELLALLALRHADEHPRRLILDLACAAVVAVGALGVLRLRVWGLFVQLGAAVALAATVSHGWNRVAGVVVLPLFDTGVFGYDWIPVAGVVSGLALVQVILCAPVFAAILRGMGSPGVVVGPR